MSNRTISISIPDDILIALNESEEELSQDMKVYTAIWLYQKGKLSIGKASELAGMDRYSFETLLSENQIPISRMTVEDIEADVRKLRKLLNE